MNSRGEIFELQTDQFPGPPRNTAVSEKECVCVCSDCATDDTGYGTDTELHLSSRKIDGRVRDTLKDFSDVDEVLNSSCVSSFDETDRPDYWKSNYKRVEEDIDSLFQSENLSYEQVDLDFPSLNCDISVPSAVDSCFVDDDFDDGYAVLKDVRRDCSFSSDGSKSLSDSPRLLGKSYRMKKCDCESKNLLTKQTIELTVRLKPQKQAELKVSTVDLCEHLLGIVPGHYGSSQSAIQNGGQRKKDRRVKVRGLVPTGVVSKHSEVRVGTY